MDVGIFNSVNDAIKSVKAAYLRYTAVSLEDREEIILSIRKKLSGYVDVIANMVYEETGMGNIEDKK